MAFMTANLSISPNAVPRLEKRIHVLTVTPFFPRLGDEGNGCFIAEPMPWIEKLGITQSVIAVQPFYYRRAEPHSSHPAQWRRFFSLPSGIGLPSAGAFLFASLLAEVRRLHASNPVHLIHAHSALPCGHAAALISRELGIPFVVTVHGLDAYSTNQVRGIAGQWCERVSRMVYRSARTVICVSEKVRERVVERAAANVNAVVIYNGVDTKLFFPAAAPVETQEILSIGTLIPIKGHELLLQAFAAVCEEFPRYSCKIIGEGPERERLGRLASQLGIENRVAFLSRQGREQIAEAIRQCSIFALPSRYEGLGCVYLEAMATAKPVIACSGQGIEEVIHNRVNGLLVEPNDRAGLSEALKSLMISSQARTEMGNIARLSILDGLTLEHQAAHLALMYRECLA